MSNDSDVAKIPWSIRDSIALFLLAWIIAPLIAVVGLGALSGAVPQLHSLSTAITNDSIALAFGLVVVEALVALGVLRIFLKRYKVSWRDLGLRRFKLLKAIVYIIGTFVALALLIAAVFALVKLLFPHFNPDQAQVNEFTQASTPVAQRIGFVALVLIPPWIEEMVFRGFMFPAFSKRFGLIWGAIISSSFFGAAHLLGAGLNVGIYTAVFGLLLCWLYRKLDSIIPGVGLHMLNNLVAYLAIMHK